MITIKENETLIAKFTIIEDSSFTGIFNIQEKCKYCRHPYKPLLQYGNFYLEILGNVLSIEYCKAGYEYNDTDSTKINLEYCPMCGRKL